MVRLSQDETRLEYEPLVKRKTFMSMFKSNSVLELKSVVTFMYGGQTSTFKRHQAQNLERIEEICKQKVTVSERYKERGYLLRLKK